MTSALVVAKGGCNSEINFNGMYFFIIQIKDTKANYIHMHEEYTLCYVKT